MKSWLIKHSIEIGLTTAIICLLFVGGLLCQSGGFKPPAEVIIELANGKLLNIEIRTGWNTNAILRFDDGSVVVIPYYVAQRHSMKEGRRYIVRRSSLTGINITIEQELENETGESK